MDVCWLQVWETQTAAQCRQQSVALNMHCWKSWINTRGETVIYRLSSCILFDILRRIIGGSVLSQRHETLTAGVRVWGITPSVKPDPTTTARLGICWNPAPVSLPPFLPLLFLHLRLHSPWFTVTNGRRRHCKCILSDCVFSCYAVNVTSFQMTGILKSEQNLQSPDGDASRQLLLSLFYHQILKYK